MLEILEQGSSISGSAFELVSSQGILQFILATSSTVRIISKTVLLKFADFLREKIVGFLSTLVSDSDAISKNSKEKKEMK